MDPFLLLLFIFGAIIGSFLNVVILRGIEGRTLTGRSACPRCRGRLRWWELIPILSFVMLRGRCARCRASISFQYPLVELAMGLAVLAAATPLPVTIAGAISAALIIVIIALLIVLFVIDLYTMLLPDKHIITLVVVVIAYILNKYELRVTSYELLSILSGILIGSGFLFLLWLATRGRGLGLGDVKLMLPVGALVGGWGAVTLLFSSFTAGGLVGIALLARRRASLKSAIPFGPFLAAAAILIILFPDLATRFHWLVWPY